MGRIEVISGVMFSGKSEELIRRLRRAKIARRSVAVFKASIDTRYNAQDIYSHAGLTWSGFPIKDPEEILSIWQGQDIVAIDEAQFFPKGIIKVVEELVDEDLRVIIAGTDRDFKGDPFGCMGELMAIADEVVKLTAICVKCGGEAIFNQRLINGQPADKNSPVIMVGGKDDYEARCRACYERPL